MCHCLSVTSVDLFTGLAIAVGLVGIVVMVLPGSLLIIGAILVWAILTDNPTAWVFFAVATVFLVLGQVLKYLIPGRRMQRAGVPNSTLLVGAALAVVGFFVIPVVGFIIGFVGGVYLAEVRRVGEAEARRTTLHALKATGLSIALELGFALVATAIWVAGVIVI